MTTVDEILVAFEHLTLEEQAEFFRRLHHWKDDDWDLQMKGDAVAGKFDRLIAEADVEEKAGALRDLP
jgi:hypothetical protein